MGWSRSGYREPKCRGRRARGTRYLSCSFLTRQVGRYLSSGYRWLISIEAPPQTDESCYDPIRNDARFGIGGQPTSSRHNFDPIPPDKHSGHRALTRLKLTHLQRILSDKDSSVLAPTQRPLIEPHCDVIGPTNLPSG